MQKRARGRPRKYDREEVLDRAIHLFSLKGYTGTSLDELSACMGMNRPSLYHAFGNKESVYRHALARFSEHLRAAVGALVVAEPDLRTALDNFYRAALDVYFASEPALGCFMFCTAPTEAIAHPEVQADMQDVLQHLDGMLEKKFRQAQCDGQFPPDAECAAAAKVAQGVLHSLAIRARAGEPRESLEQMSRFAVDALCVCGVGGAGRR